MRRFLAGTAIVCWIAGVASGTPQDDFGWATNSRHGGLVADLSVEIRQLRKPHQIASRIRPATSPTPPAAVAPTTVRMSPYETDVDKAMARTGSFDFNTTPLNQVVDWFRSELNIDNIVLDRGALEDEGIDAASEGITFSASPMSFGAALHHLLRPLNLTTTFENQTLVVTSEEHAEEVMRARVYPVWDLVEPLDEKQSAADYDTLMRLIANTVAHSSWDSVGGPGNLDAYKGLLTVSNTTEVHREIMGLLGALRRFPIVSTDASKAVKSYAAESSRKQSAARALLEKRVSFEFHDSPLINVVEWLEEGSPIPVLLDAQGLEDEGIDASSEGITAQLTNVTVGTGLNVILADLGLAHVFDHEAVVITSAEAAENMLRTKVYGCVGLIDVADATDISLLADELQQLIELIRRTIHTSSWDHYGGPGAISAFPSRGTLVVSQTDEVHRRIAAFLHALQNGREDPLAAPRTASVTGATPTVKSYVLSSAFVEEAAQRQLIQLLEEVLRDSDNAVNSSATKYRIQQVPGRLVISHRRDAHVWLNRVLQKVGALDLPDPGRGGMF